MQRDRLCYGVEFSVSKCKAFNTIPRTESKHMPVELHLSLEFDNANLEVKSKSHLFGIKLHFQGKNG